MKALTAPSYGPVDQLAVTDVPDLTPGPGQLLLRVQAAALNPVDIRVITGEFADMFPVTHPFVVGMDAAGAVAAVGEGVSRYAVGDKVLAYTHSNPGTIAEYTLVAEGPQVAHRPPGLDAVRGAALPAVAMTAEARRAIAMRRDLVRTVARRTASVLGDLMEARQAGRVVTRLARRG